MYIRVVANSRFMDTEALREEAYRIIEAYEDEHYFSDCTGTIWIPKPIGFQYSITKVEALEMVRSDGNEVHGITEDCITVQIYGNGFFVIRR